MKKKIYKKTKFYFKEMLTSFSRDYLVWTIIMPKKSKTILNLKKNVLEIWLNLKNLNLFFWQNGAILRRQSSILNSF